MKSFFILLCSFYSLFGYAQICMNIDTLRTQSEVDQFKMTYGTCTTIDGDLIINWNGGGMDAIKNLDSLSGIETITGNLKIDNVDSLKDISALISITEIGDSLIIEGNDVLNDLTGLDDVESVGGLLSICCTGDGPVNLDHLGNITSIGGSLELCCSSSFYETVGMNSLTSIGGSVYICCATFNFINGFPNLITIGDSLRISSSSDIQMINGFPRLRSIENSLRIESMSNLEEISGFGKLIYVGGNVTIRNVESLNSACGLYALLDEEDDGDPGPGINPPDVGGMVTIENAGAIESIDDIIEEGPCRIIPTLSQWGIVILLSLLLIFGVQMGKELRIFQAFIK